MRLNDAQIAAYRTDGFVVVEDVVPEAALASLAAGYTRWIDARARALRSEGKLADLAEDAPWDRRLSLLYAQCREIEKGLDVMEARLPEAFAFLRCPELLDAVEALVGPEILCSPIQHVRGKVPHAMSEGGFFNVPWHQDQAVTWEEADHSEIVTCWVALADATVENGCMEVLPGVWRSGYLPHHAGPGGTQIRPEALPDVAPVPVPVRRGGMVFLHRATPHRSTPNRTADQVRWSFDIRYQPVGQPTGRPFHPAFVARSHAHPDTELRDHATWSRLWEDALSQPSPRAHRSS